MVYLDLVVLLNFLVDFLLILAANRICGFPPGFLRAAGAAVLGGVYAAACLIPGFRFLSNSVWRMVSLSLMSLAAFGCNASALRRGVVFVLLCMALGGLAMGVQRRDFTAVCLCALCLWGMCTVGFQGGIGQREYIPVELCFRGRKLSLLALRDTGNLLKDPITGERVLVAGADVGWELLELTGEQLRHPVQTLASGFLSGLRLIPYKSVGQPSGMLLAMRMEGAKINGKSCSPLVAFAPDRIGRTDVYRMLAGGV